MEGRDYSRMATRKKKRPSDRNWGERGVMAKTQKYGRKGEEVVKNGVVPEKGGQTRGNSSSLVRKKLGWAHTIQ